MAEEKRDEKKVDEKTKAVKPEPGKALKVPAPPAVPAKRMLVVSTDGTLIKIEHQAVSDLELKVIGQALISEAENRERAAVQKQQAQAQRPSAPSP